MKNGLAQQMLIVEKYEQAIAYLYPIIQNTPRKHGVARDRFLNCLFNQVDLVTTAGKTGHVSSLYKADANLSMLRFYARFFRTQLRAITPRQEEIALAMIAETGKLIGAWIAKKQKGN